MRRDVLLLAEMIDADAAERQAHVDLGGVVPETHLS